MTRYLWTTREGRTLPIEEMETDHLRNCIAMLRRNGRVTPAEAGDPFTGGPPQGDMASYYWEQAVAEWRPGSRVLEALENELETRERKTQPWARQ